MTFQQLNEEDRVFDSTLRPRTFEEFVGQEQMRKKLSTWVEAAKRRGEPLDHLLFSGPPGLGKTTLAHIIAHEMNAEIVETSGPALERPADLVGVLTNLKRGDFLFIDEVHRLGTAVEEYLYSAIEDYKIDIIIDQGPSARSIRIDVQRFTLIGATTREGLLTAPFRARFGIIERLDYYPPEDLRQIALRTGRILNVEIAPESAELVSRRARGTPRIANRIMRRLRDVAEVQAAGKITLDVAKQGLDMLGIDEKGLEEMDRRILLTIINQGGGPVGLKTIAVSVGEEEDTIEEVYEPFLIQQGYLQKTPRGRTVTESAYRHLNRKLPINGQNRLF